MQSMDELKPPGAKLKKALAALYALDPDFGTNGTVKWRAVVRNLTDRPIESVELGFETFDKDGRLLTSRSSYVSAIPPNSSRSDESYADFYGTEAKANISVKRVRFSGS